MDIHYNAFISYRHHPEDIKVAEQIHKSLEHYRVPKAIRAKKDTKMRLFRDKEELPITSNLTDDITRALRNSDFLIVICSTHTKESLWVQREIETFLQTHDHSRVLTVLVNGEPYDTIPEILCSQEQIDPVTGEKQLLPIEPLSCDWRTSRKKAMWEELPRLAAALLGCGYDELRQRERQYRTRRLVTIFSVALAALLALMGYVIHNSMQIQKANDQLAAANNQLEVANDQLTDANIEIQKNLEESLINQSQYLASASVQQREEGDRLLAISLALEGLPTEQNPRPYVTEAELALSKAVGAYVAESEMVAVGAITCDALISHFQATDEREWMYVYDQRNVLSVWELETFRNHTSVQMTESAQELLVTPDNNVIVQSYDNKLYCFDHECELLWQAEDYSDVAFSTDRQTLLTYGGDHMVHFLDAKTGKPVREPVLAELPEAPARVSFLQDYYDIAGPVALKYDSYKAVCMDFGSGSISLLNEHNEDTMVRRTGTTADGNLLVLTSGEEAMWNADYGEMSTYSPVDVLLTCYSPENTRQLWQVTLRSYTYCEVHTLEVIPGTNNIFCQVDNLFAVIDGQTGTLLGTCEMGAIPVWVQPYDTYALAMMEDGAMGSYTYERNEFNSSRYLKEDLVQGFAGKGCYVNQWMSNQILVYGSEMDDNWQMFAGDYDYVEKRSAQWGDLHAVYDYDGIALFDGKTQAMRWYLPEPDGANLQLLDFSEDGSLLWALRDSDMIAINAQTGDYEIYSLEDYLDDEASLYYNTNYRAHLDAGKIYLYTEELFTEAQYVLRFDTATQKAEHLLLCEIDADRVISPKTELLSVCNNVVLAWEKSTQKLYKADFQSGEVKVLLEDVPELPMVQFVDVDGRYVIARNNQVQMYSAQDQLLLTISMEQTNGVSFCLRDDALLVLADSGAIYRYDLSGTLLNKTPLDIYQSYFSNVSYDYIPEDIPWIWIGEDDLFVGAFRAGNLIDCKNWLVRAFIPECVAYLPESDQFLTSPQDGERYALGAYHRYSLEDMRNLADEALKGYTLTQEQKDKYGLS